MRSFIWWALREDGVTHGRTKVKEIRPSALDMPSPRSFGLISRISSHPAVFFSYNKPANNTFNTINQRNEHGAYSSGIQLAVPVTAKTPCTGDGKRCATLVHTPDIALAREMPFVLAFVRKRQKACAEKREERGKSIQRRVPLF
jgi:hypothetical protein